MSNKALLPDELLLLILKKEWQNVTHLKGRLNGKRPFPIKLSLKPPKGRKALEHLDHFTQFIKAWKSYKNQQFIEWENNTFRELGAQRVPRYFILLSFDDLIVCLGDSAKTRSQLWQRNMAPLLTLDSDTIYPVLVRHLTLIETISVEESTLIKKSVLQLKANMGMGLYLRALPLIGIDTKFLEQKKSLVSDLLDALYDGEVTKQGGLMPWLGCEENPKGWIFVLPLCKKVQEKMAGLPILQLPTQVLMQQALPAKHILVVENVQSGLGLPMLKDTIAVFGGGKNVQWLGADWLKQKKVGYWGDIDSWGLGILSDVRKLCSHVNALMMDEKTLTQFENRMVQERTSVKHYPQYLNNTEIVLFELLTLKENDCSRLEQERLSSDYIKAELDEWLKD